MSATPFPSILGKTTVVAFVNTEDVFPFQIGKSTVATLLASISPSVNASKEISVAPFIVKAVTSLVVPLAANICKASKLTNPDLIVIDNEEAEYLDNNPMSKLVAAVNDNTSSPAVAPPKSVKLVKAGKDTDVVFALVFKITLSAETNFGKEISPSVSTVKSATPVKAVKPAVGTTEVPLAL